ncbi:YveK family protein [Haloimpatiens lingqiaonensis]|uniref:YveK family protein n=1 Tax=Haloimpatiens lingqiaonensis TaxID=1380675 RepID=UPI0010FDCF62|nr:Wzz/FepE/Etk N-terminal domain-containing protein [Haloimpatiens lingqiaonensis]
MTKDITLGLREVLWILRKRRKLIIGTTLLATIIAGVVSFFLLTPVYQSKVSVVIGKGNMGETGTNYKYDEVMMYQKLMKTYAEIAKLQSVAQETVKNGNLDMTTEQLKSSVKVMPQVDTQIMDIVAESQDPNKAKIIADIYTEEFIKKSSDSMHGGEVKVLDKARASNNPVKPNKKLNMAIGFFLGLMVSIGITLLLEYLDSTIKTDNDVAIVLDMTIMGVIQKY